MRRCSYPPRTELYQRSQFLATSKRRLQHQHTSVHCLSCCFTQIRTNHLISHEPISNWQPGCDSVSVTNSGASGRYGGVRLGLNVILRICNLYEFQLSKKRAMTQAVSSWPLNAEAWVRFRASAGGICEQCGNGTDFSPTALIFPCTIIPPLLHTHIYTTFIRGTSGRGLESWQSYIDSRKNSSSVYRLLIASRMSCRCKSKTNCW